MLGMTHMFAGITAAFAFVRPHGFEDCLCVIAGGAAGGVISDIDLRSVYKQYRYYNDWKPSPTIIFTGKLVFITMLTDAIVNGKMAFYIRNTDLKTLLQGISFFMILYITGMFTKHRGFTHSIFAMILFSCSIKLFCEPAAMPFLAGYASHLILDFLNKKSLRLFFPFKKGICLNLCYSNRVCDKLFLTGSILIDLIFLINIFLR